MAADHPGDRRFSDLDAAEQDEIARGWEARPKDAEALFNAMSVETRWEVLCTLTGRNGSYQAENARLAENADPATSEAFGGLYPLNPLCPHSERPWPVMDGAAFYGLPGEVVAALEPHTEADPAAILLTYLTAYGAAVGRGPHARADGAHHAGRLFIVVVGDTSKARKGTSFAQVRRIFVAADERFASERILGGFGSGEALVDAISDGEDHRLLVVEPEWARILSVGRREGSTLSPLLRQAWDGDRLAVRSRGKGVVAAEGAHISVVGHVTVEELRAKLVDTEVANGFANRHLFVLAKRSKLLPTGGRLDELVVDDLARKTRMALAEARRSGSCSGHLLLRIFGIVSTEGWQKMNRAVFWVRS